MGDRLRLRIAALFFVGLGAGGILAAPARAAEPLVGLDHVPTVVSNLEAASRDFAAFGFAIKPGRAHEDGLRNAHIKMPDGAGIELLMPPPDAVEGLAGDYRTRLSAGEGPVHLMLHARDLDALRAALTRAGIGFLDEAGSLVPTEPALDAILFGRDNRSPSDRPAHFAHTNGSRALAEVWLAPDPVERRAIEGLMAALGTSPIAVSDPLQSLDSPDSTGAPESTVTAYPLASGRLLLLPLARRVLPGRPIAGLRFAVDGSTAATPPTVAPEQAHGLWLSFQLLP